MGNRAAVHIIHKRKTVVTAQRVTSIFGKMRGLMFTFRPQALLFENEADEYVSLHMWFVFYPIDVLYLDRDGVVVELVERFLPFTMHVAQKKARFVLEVRAGTIRKHGIRVGSRLLLHLSA